MRIFLALALLAAAVPPAFADSSPLHGRWFETDVRTIEAVDRGACVRIWLEERTYDFFPSGSSRFNGIYSNIIRAVPVGTSALRDCRYPPPAENPLATQIRNWVIAGKATSEKNWRVGAEPGLPGGDLRAFKSDYFDTTLIRRQDRLADLGGTDGSDEPGRTLLFRPPAPQPAAARAVLEETIRRLHGGACLAVLATLVPSPDAAREMCDLRQRMAQIAGRLLSVSVIEATEFDRVPAGFRRAPAEGFRRQHGVFFAFLERFEEQTVAGNAIVVEEEKGWEVASLWF